MTERDMAHLSLSWAAKKFLALLILASMGLGILVSQTTAPWPAI